MVLDRTPPCPRLEFPLALSITVDDLPRRRPVRVRHLPCGHRLIVVRDGLEYGHLERIYQLRLRGPVRSLLYQAFGVPDPDIDPDGYAAAAWWDPADSVSGEIVHAMEARLRLTPWPHGVGRALRARA